MMLELLVSGALWTAPDIQISGAPFSCRIVRQRVATKAKAHRGLSAFLASLGQGASWKERDFRRLESLIGAAGYFPKSMFERRVRLELRWPVDNDWAAILDSPDPLKVAWSFKAWRWEDERGMMPDEVQSVWNSPSRQMELSLQVSPVELCFGDKDLRLSLRHGDRVLELQSIIEWL